MSRPLTQGREPLTLRVMVKRQPNLKISQWMRAGSITAEYWDSLALCRGRHDLPWTADTRPPPATILAMTELCAECPVRKRCAERALKFANTGGFFAGVWMPWGTSIGELGNRTQRQIGRQRLKRIAAS